MPPTRTRPALGASSAPARCSRVDLPQPDGPITATSSPGATDIVTWRSAKTSVSPCPYDLTTSRNSRIGRLAMGWSASVIGAVTRSSESRRCVFVASRSRDSQRSSHRRSASARTISASATRRCASSLSPLRGAAALAAVAAAQLQQRQQRGALAGEHVERVRRPVLDGHQHLQHQLVAWRRVVDRHRLPPRAERLAPGRGDLVRLLAVVLAPWPPGRRARADRAWCTPARR